MPDISMCISDACPKAKKCFRYMAMPNKYWQSYCEFLNEGEIKNGKECDAFWPLKDKTGPIRRLTTKEKKRMNVH